MSKICCRCKKDKTLECYGALRNTKDGLRYDCKDCRTEYRKSVSNHVKEKNKKYYEENREELLIHNKEYRDQNKEAILQQRKEYRNREDVKKHIQEKNKAYLPIRKERIKERRRTDTNFQLSEILRSKIHKMLKGHKTSYINYIGCDVEWLKTWIAFRFDENMNWDNLGSYWQLDHILPIHGFNLTNENEKRICFHWTNLQPLSATENRQKSDNLQLHYYFNNIVNIYRFNKTHTQILGYEVLNESLKWLRIELRYRNNAPYNSTIVDEIGNPQPSL
jgi:hypothetical protein